MAWQLPVDQPWWLRSVIVVPIEKGAPYRDMTNAGVTIDLNPRVQYISTSAGSVRRMLCKAGWPIAVQHTSAASGTLQTGQ